MDNRNFRIVGNTEAQPLLWLHGFMGSGNDWLDLARSHFPDYCNILLDLPGHGKTRIPTDPVLTNMLSEMILDLARTGYEKFIPIGYSMGGRVGFHLHQLAPERIPAFVFLSSAPGLKTRDERDQRILDDEHLMDKLESVGFEAFLKEWYAAPLFGDLKNNSSLLSTLCQKRSTNDPKLLRKALALMGNGALPSLWGSLKNIGASTLLVTGELDSKYSNLNQKMNQEISGSIHQSIANAGHAFHLEKPLETARIIRHFLSEKIEGE